MRTAFRLTRLQANSTTAVLSTVTASSPKDTPDGTYRTTGRATRFTPGGGPTMETMHPCGVKHPTGVEILTKRLTVRKRYPSCNRPYGHSGNHRAVRQDAVVFAEWPNETEGGAH